MTIADQIQKIKDNWLLVALLLFAVIFFSGITNFAGMSSVPYMGQMESMAYDRGYYPGDDGFAPDVEERVIIKTAYMTTEVDEFSDADGKLRSIVTSSDSFLLNENVNQYDQGWKSYYRGSYTIKVPTTKYDSVIDQLKDIGEVQSFSEDARDVTGTYTDLQTELDAEKQRLARYEGMYEEATDTEDKITLSDHIFNQERRIKYLEERLENIDNRVDYSQVTVNIQEKQSEYADITFTRLSQLVKDLVGSFNALLRIAFILLPWVVAIKLVLFIMNRLKR